MRILGFILIAIGFIDFGLSFIGIDFYAIFGIYLTGVAYQYSPLVVGTVGTILVYKSSADEDNQNGSQHFLNADEQLILQKTANGRRGSFNYREPGTLFITDKRVGFMGVSQFGQEASGELDFECELEQISSLNGSFLYLEIHYNDKTFKCAPGPSKPKLIIAEIERLKGKEPEH